MNVVGATPHAEAVGETAAVEGRITRTLHGVQPNRGVRYGASGRVARFLLAVREFEPDRRFACNLRFDEAVADVLNDRDLETVVIDVANRPESGEAVAGASSIRRLAGEAFADRSPAVVCDRGGDGPEPLCRVTAVDAETLRRRVLDLLDAVRNR